MFTEYVIIQNQDKQSDYYCILSTYLNIYKYMGVIRECTWYYMINLYLLSAVPFRKMGGGGGSTDRLQFDKIYITQKW